MSFPTDDDDIVTTRDLRVMSAELRTELDGIHTELRHHERIDRLSTRIDDQGHRHGVMLEQILATFQPIGERQSANDDAQTRGKRSEPTLARSSTNWVEWCAPTPSGWPLHDQPLATHNAAIAALGRRRRR